MMDKSTKVARSIVGVSEGRPKDDFYPTPPMVTRALMRVEEFTGDIWEPACGNGAISKELATRYRVISTDLIPRGFGDPLNFLETFTLQAPNIVTNPPFILAEEFVVHALNLGAVKVAMFEKLAFLEGGMRSHFLERSPLRKVWVFRKRVKLYREGDDSKGKGGMIAFAWFVWERGYKDEPRIGWI